MTYEHGTLDYWRFSSLPGALRALSAILAATAWTLTPTQSRAASATNAADPSVLEEILVTADRRNSYGADFVQAGSFRGARQIDTPLTINVLPDALLQSQQALGLLDALRNIAGVSPSQTSTTVYSNVAIRGINVENRGNYRLNGILPIVNLIDLPLEDKDRIEALKGASAIYYGFTTPAGIINLTMKRPTPDPHVAATIFGNGFGGVGGHLDVGNTWGVFGARVNAVYGLADPGIDNTRGHRSLLAAALDFKPRDNIAVTLDVEHILKSVNEPGVFRYTQFPTPTLANLYPDLLLPPLLAPTVNFGPDWALNLAEEQNLLAAVNWKLSPKWALSASYGTSHLTRDRHFNTINLDTYGPTSTGDGNLTIGQQPGATFDNANYRAELAGAFTLWSIDHQLLAGVSRNIRDAFNSTNVPATCPGATPTAPRVTCRQNVFDPVDIPETALPARTGTRARIDDIGYYLFDRIEVTHWLQVLAGLRKADYTESNLDTGATTFHDDPTSLSYGVVVKPRAWLSLFATYIEGQESTPAAPIIATNFGESLPATQSTQREVGIKMEIHPGLLLQAAYFNIERDSAYLNSANLYVLDGRARFNGVEFSATGEITSRWSLYASGQFLTAVQISGAETRVTTNTATGVVTVVPTVVGRKIENTPERTFSLATEYRLSGPLAGLSVNGAAYYLSERAVNPLNQAFIPGYTLFDLGAAYTGAVAGREVTVRVTAQNVSDKRYFSSTGGSIVAQGPPRMFKFSLTTRF